MTAEPNPTPEVPADTLVITAPSAPTVVTGERTPFQLPPSGHDDDTAHEVLWAVRPKSILLMHISERLNSALEHPDDQDTLLNALRQFVNGCLDPDTQDRIWDRLGDPTDALDLPHIDALRVALFGRWMPSRPTGPRSGASRLPRTSGKRSTGQRPSKASTPES